MNMPKWFWSLKFDQGSAQAQNLVFENLPSGGFTNKNGTYTWESDQSR